MSITKKIGMGLGAALIAGFLFFGGASFLLPSSPIGGLIPYTICSGGVYIDKFGRLFGDRTPVAEAAPCGYTDADAVAAAEAEDPFDHAGVVNFNWNAIRIYNPADTFYYNIQASAIVANRTLTLPLTSGTIALVGGSAPLDATYITQTPDGDLTSEQALSALASGIMRVATATGVVTSLTTSAGIIANISDETGSGLLVFATSPVLTTPNIGAATGTSLATSAATPLLLTNGQLVNIALTAQTVGATTLTIPNFASVSDTFAFTTLAQALTNKSIALGSNTITSTSAQLITALSDETGSGLAVFGTSPVLTTPQINGIVTTTGLTLPAFTAGGNITGGAGFTIGTSAGDLVLNPAGEITTTRRYVYSGLTPRRLSSTANVDKGPWLTDLLSIKGLSDNVLTNIITVTVPNVADGSTAIILAEWAITTDAGRSGETGQLRVDIHRRFDNNTVATLALSLAGVEQQSGPDPETLAVTWAVDAMVGAATATQTFNIELTVDTSMNVPVQAHLYARLLSVSGRTSQSGAEVTMAVAP